MGTPHSQGDIVLAGAANTPRTRGKYKHIADLLKKGNVIPFLGMDAAILSLKKELSRKMARLTGLDQNASPLTLMSQYYETKTSRYDLYDTIKETVLEELELQSPRAHRLLATVEKPLIVLTSMYDSMLEKAFQEQDKRYSVFGTTTD